MCYKEITETKFFCKSFNRFKTCDCTDTSNALTGSSATINLGRIAKALAIPIL